MYPLKSQNRRNKSDTIWLHSDDFQNGQFLQAKAVGAALVESCQG